MLPPLLALTGIAPTVPAQWEEKVWDPEGPV